MERTFFLIAPGHSEAICLFTTVCNKPWSKHDQRCMQEKKKMRKTEMEIISNLRSIHKASFYCRLYKDCS